MSDSIGKVSIDFQAQVAQFTSAVTGVNARLEEFGKHAQDAHVHASAIFEGLFEFETFKKGLEVAREGVEKLAEAFEEVGKIGRDALKLGISAEAMSQFQHAANATHVDVEALSTGIDHLNREIGKVITGDASAKAAADALKQLGLDARDLASNSPDETFKAVAQALGNVHSTYERAAIAQDLFGRGGRELTPIMAHLNELMAESDQIGFTRTAEQIEAAEREERELARITDQIKASLMSLATSGWAEALIAKVGDVARSFALLTGPRHFSDALEAQVAALAETDRHLKEIGKNGIGASLEERAAAQREYAQLLQKEVDLTRQIDENAGALGLNFSKSWRQFELDTLGALSRAKKGVQTLDAQLADARLNEQLSDQLKKLADEVLAADDNLGPLQRKVHDALANMKDMPLPLQVAAGALEKMAQNADEAKAAMAEQKAIAQELARLRNEVTAGGDEKTRRLLEFNQQHPGASAADKQEYQALLDLQDAQKQHAKDLAEANQIIKESQSPLEKYNDEIQRLNELRAQGLLNANQYGQALSKYNDELAKATQPKEDDRQAAAVARRFDFFLPPNRPQNAAERAVQVQQQILGKIDQLPSLISDLWTKLYLGAGPTGNDNIPFTSNGDVIDWG